MTSWSYSAYSTAVQCLRKYKLCYVDKIGADYDSGDMAFGSALHSAINTVVSGDPSGGGEVFKIYWDSYEGRSDLVYGRYKWEHLKELGLNFLSKFERMHAKKYKVETAEVRLYATYKGVKLEGTLDFYGIYDGRRSLRDFKTSGYNYPKEKTQTALQLYLYTYLAMQNGYEKPETLGYTVFNKGTGSIQDLTWDFDEKKMYDALEDMIEYCYHIDSMERHDGTGHPKNLNACMDFNRKCPYWSKCHGESNE